MSVTFGLFARSQRFARVQDNHVFRRMKYWCSEGRTPALDLHVDLHGP